MKAKSTPNEEMPTASPSLLRPIAIEKVESKGDGIVERKTKLTYSPATNDFIEQSADQILSLASSNPAILIDHLFWHALLPWLCNSPEDVELFWTAFDREGAVRNRDKAVNGTSSVNRTNERMISGLAKEIWGLRNPLDGVGIFTKIIEESDQHSEYVDSLLKRLGEWVVEAVTIDVEAPKRLHEVLKFKDKTRTTKEGDLFCAFVRLIAEDMRLPTKKRVRLEAGWGSENEDYQKASKAFSAMGLSGLPEG